MDREDFLVNLDKRLLERRDSMLEKISAINSPIYVEKLIDAHNNALKTVLENVRQSHEPTGAHLCPECKDEVALSLCDECAESCQSQLCDTCHENVSAPLCVEVKCECGEDAIHEQKYAITSDMVAKYKSEALEGKMEDLSLEELTPTEKYIQSAMGPLVTFGKEVIPRGYKDAVKFLED